MNFTKNLIASSVAASAVVLSAFAPLANADVTGTAGVASTYLWRGADLGSGTPAVSGDLKYSQSGFYTGIWGSSGDTYAGTEYDLYAGYGMSFGADDLFKIDVSLWNYNYPTGLGYLDDPDTEIVEQETDFGKLSDLVIAFSVGPVTATIYDNVAGAPSGSAYYTLAGGVGAFSVLVGMHDSAAGDDPVHVNLNYAFNSKLTFTLSQFVADEPEDDDLKFVVSYSLPIGE
jgi:uncharacterized protein (TIGR02001 family)